MEIISSELKNLRSSGGGGGCEKKNWRANLSVGEEGEEAPMQDTNVRRKEMRVQGAR